MHIKNLHLRKSLLKNVSGKVLEIGFGDLNNISYLGDKVSLFVGYDIDFEYDMLEPKDFGFGFPIQLFHSEYLLEYIPDDFFDSFVITFSLCTIEEPSAFLKLLKRKLKSSGALYFLEHGSARGGSALIRSIQNNWNPIQKKIADGCNINRDIPGIISEAGFSIESMDEGFTGLFRPWNYTYRGIARKL